MHDLWLAARRRAPQALGWVRLFFGSTALFAPTIVARRLGVDPEVNASPVHPLRMFGIRTVLIGGELLFGDRHTRERSIRLAPLIHAADTLSAALAGLGRQMPARVAVFTTLVSAGNTVLALMAQPVKGRSDRPGESLLRALRR
jgi:hypothetical protein